MPLSDKVQDDDNASSGQLGDHLNAVVNFDCIIVLYVTVILTYSYCIIVRWIIHKKSQLGL